MTQLAQANADKAKYKNSIDKLTKNNGDLTKQLREHMTAEEQLAQAQKEADETHQAYVKELEDFVSGIYRTGVGEDLDLEIPGYAVPKIPRPKRDSKGKLTGWHPADIAWMSIGYRTQIPPISVINFYNGI